MQGKQGRTERHAAMTLQPMEMAVPPEIPFFAFSEVSGSSVMGAQLAHNFIIVF